MIAYGWKKKKLKIFKEKVIYLYITGGKLDNNSHNKRKKIPLRSRLTCTSQIIFFNFMNSSYWITEIKLFGEKRLY